MMCSLRQNSLKSSCIGLLPLSDLTTNHSVLLEILNVKYGYCLGDDLPDLTPRANGHGGEGGSAQEGHKEPRKFWWGVKVWVWHLRGQVPPWERVKEEDRKLELCL